MDSRNYADLHTLIFLGAIANRQSIVEWCAVRETDLVVGVAIHATAGAQRDPDTIWEDPTDTEVQHVTMAVEEAVNAGEYDRAEDGRYHWGQARIVTAGS